MPILGKRIKRTKLVQADQFVVAVDVEMVYPEDDPSEPCYEAETIKLLKDVKAHADRGDVTWLKQHGKVYSAIEAA